MGSTSDWTIDIIDDHEIIYVAFGPTAQTNFRSIGTNTGNLHPLGNASVPQGSTTVTFTAALPVPTAVGVVGPGDQLDIEGEILFIQTRDSDFQVTLQSAATGCLRHLLLLNHAYPLGNVLLMTLFPTR